MVKDAGNIYQKLSVWIVCTRRYCHFIFGLFHGEMAISIFFYNFLKGEDLEKPVLETIQIVIFPPSRAPNSSPEEVKFPNFTMGPCLEKSKGAIIVRVAKLKIQISKTF